MRGWRKHHQDRCRRAAVEMLWRVATVDANERRESILACLAERMPPEAYAQELIDLTKSKDRRVRIRALELISKLQGAIDDGQPRAVVVAFSSMLTGRSVSPHAGGSGQELPEGE